MRSNRLIRVMPLFLAITAPLILNCASPSEARADGHFRRLFGGWFHGDTVLVEPTTYVIPSASACCGNEQTVVVESSWRPARPTRYVYVDETYALPTRYVVSSLSTLDLPVITNSASICCDPSPSCCEPGASTTAYTTSKPKAASGSGATPKASGAATPKKEITSRPAQAGSDKDDDIIPPPRDVQSTGAGATPRTGSETAASRPNPSASDAAKKSNDLDSVLPPLPPARNDDTDTKKADASTKDAAGATPKTESNPPAPATAKDDAGVGKTAANPNPDASKKDAAATKAESPLESLAQPEASDPADVGENLIRRDVQKPVVTSVPKAVDAGAVLEGKVIDIKTREPLVGVKVVLADLSKKQTNQSWTTDALGRYAFKAPAGQWRLTAETPEGKSYYYGDIVIDNGAIMDANGRKYTSLTLKR